MKLRGLTLIVCLIGAAMTLFGVTDRQRAKARYYFMQGSLEASQNNSTSAYEYFKKAYETDPTYADAAYTYGSVRIFLPNQDVQSAKELLNSLQLMKNYLDENPGDLYASQMYGYLATRLDTLPEAIRIYENIYSQMPSQTPILMTLSEVYMLNKDARSAIEAVERYEKIEGKSANISLKKVTYMLSDGDTIGAISEVNNLIEAKPRDAYSRILKGNLYEVLEQPDSVLKAYKEAEQLAPESGSVKMSLANYYRELGDSVMLDNMVYEALLSDDLDLDDKVSILGEYLQKLIEESGEKSRGDYLFKVLQTQYPLEPDLMELSSRYSAAKGNFKEAAEEIEYAIALDRTNERYWLMLMSFLLSDSRFNDIINSYKRAEKNIEPSIGLKTLYAASATQIENTKEAKAIMKDLLLEVNPLLIDGTKEQLDSLKNTMDYDTLEWVSNLYCHTGDIDYKAGESEEGFEAYDKSLLFNPENPLTLNNFAYFLAEENKDLERAKEMSWKSIELSGNNPTYLDTYAWILYKLGEYQQALEYQRLAIELAKETDDNNEEFDLHLKEIEKALATKEK